MYCKSYVERKQAELGDQAGNIGYTRAQCHLKAGALSYDSYNNSYSYNSYFYYAGAARCYTCKACTASSCPTTAAQGFTLYIQ